jgi:hypothetical protein
MINILKQVLHMIPFIHFYDKWSDTNNERTYCGDERQSRYCIICNKKQYRTVNNQSFLDK